MSFRGEKAKSANLGKRFLALGLPRGVASRRFAATACQLLIALLLATLATGAIAESLESTYPPKATYDEIRQLIAKRPHSHPRLFAIKSELASLPASLDSGSLQRVIGDYVLSRARELRSIPPVERTLEGVRMLKVSRTCVERILVLSTAFYLDGDLRHVARCQQEMLAAASFSDWNPDHFLDVAEMSLALGVGYDWLNEHLDESTRREVREALVKKALEPAFDPRYNSWRARPTNWGQVCHGGLTVGALAVMDDFPDLAARTVLNALHNVTPAMDQYAPRGGYPEGPLYWGYGTSYSVLLIDSLQSALGNEFGLSLAPGFNQTGGFPALTSGPTGRFFSYADSGSRRDPQPVLYWLANRFDRPEWLLDERRRLVEQLAKQSDRHGGWIRFLPLLLLWTDASLEEAPSSLPLHWNSGGDVPITVHRGSWTDPNSTFVGMKGGSPSASHGQMDAGSFVLESDQERWATDLGSENYHRIESLGMDLWGRYQTSDRWKVFRLSNHGHNTLAINSQLQNVEGSASVAAFSAEPGNAFTVIDLSTIYSPQAEKVLRGVRLLRSGEVILQDELSGLKPGSLVRWSMVSAASPSEEDNSVLVLRRNGKRLVLTIRSPAGSAWRQLDSASPRNAWDSPNPGTSILAFESIVPATGKLMLKVVATPGSCQEPLAKRLPDLPIEQWSGSVD